MSHGVSAITNKMDASVNNPEDKNVASVSETSLSPLVMFSAKTIIVVSVCTTAVIVSSSFLSRHVERVVGSFSNVIDRASTVVDGTFRIGGGAFWTKLETELDRMADPQAGLTPERQERLLVKLRAASEKWKPFLTEAYMIVTEPPHPAKAPSKN
jgi:hypothetical protein